MKSKRLRLTGTYAVIILGALIMSAPLFYLVSASLMTAGEIRSFPPKLFPSTPIWSNFAEAFDFLTPRVILNSFVFTLGVLSVQLLISIPAGFALAKIPFRWTGIILALFVIPLFVPSNMTLIPLFLVTNELSLVGTYAGLILPVAGQTAFAVLLFRQFFVGIPQGLIEAARIDGAGWSRTLWAIAIPLARPAIAAYSCITFLTAWNMYIWPQIVAPTKDMAVMTVALAPLAQGQYSTFSPSIGLAAAVLSMLPVLTLFVIFQKWFVNGVVGTGLE